MKTIKSRKSKMNLKVLLAMLATGFALTANPMVAHAELVDETDEWKQEGEQHNEDISQQEQDQHTQENINNQNNGGETPAPQDAQAVVDNSQGGEKPAEQPQPINHPEQDFTEPHNKTTDPRYDGKDEWEIKFPETTPTPTPEPDKPDEPHTPDNPGTPTVTVTVTPNPKKPMSQTDDDMFWLEVAAALAAGASGIKIVTSRKSKFIDRQDKTR